MSLDIVKIHTYSNHKLAMLLPILQDWETNLYHPPSTWPVAFCWVYLLPRGTLWRGRTRKDRSTVKSSTLLITPAWITFDELLMWILISWFLFCFNFDIKRLCYFSWSWTCVHGYRIESILLQFIKPWSTSWIISWDFSTTEVKTRILRRDEYTSSTIQCGSSCTYTLYILKCGGQNDCTFSRC